MKKKKYALSKYKFEKAYKEISNINCKNVIARCFTFIGTNVPLDQHFAIGNFYNSVINNKKILINSKSNIFRSYMDATDLVDWLMTIFLNNKLEFDIFNVGSEEKPKFIWSKITKFAERNLKIKKGNSVYILLKTMSIKINNTSIKKIINSH